jgi:hypothetical protein
MDFVKTGVLLTLLLSVLVLVLIPFFWPLHSGSGDGPATTPTAYSREPQRVEASGSGDQR